MEFRKKLRKRKYRLIRSRKINLKKGLAFLPNLFTFGNAFFGFYSIILSTKGEFFAAAYFILLGALMDALDGRIARLVGSCSELGVQLDSLSDAVSFCLAPSLLIYFWQLKRLGFLGILVCFLFLLAGLLRLARFNVIHEKQTIFFIGVPTTIAGCFLSTVLLNLGHKDPSTTILFFVLLLTLILAWLMISSVRFPAFKQRLFRPSKNWYIVASIMLFAVVAVMQLHQILLLFFLLYFFSSFFVKFLKIKDRRTSL